MKRYLLSITVAIAALIVANNATAQIAGCNNVTCGASPSTGSGTSTDPYTICEGKDVNFNPQGGGHGSGLSYTISGPNGFLASVSSGNVHFTNVSLAAAGVYTVTATGGTGDGSLHPACGTMISYFTLAVNPAPHGAITSLGTSICNGSSTTISGTVTAIGAWTLTLSDGSTASGTGNSSWSINVSPTTNTTYTITSLNDANCGSTGSSGYLTGSETVTVNSNPTASTSVAGNVVTVSGAGGTGTGTYTYSGTGTQSPSGTFTVSAPGTYTYTVTDGNGCSGSATGTVTCSNPTISCTNVTASANGSCQAAVTYNAPTTGGIPAPSVSYDISDGSTFSLGTTTVTATASNGCGTDATTTFTVTVNDVTAPSAPTLSDVTAECSATVSAPTASDNCSGAVTGTTNDPTSYSAQGDYTITWTFTDAAGNSSTATQNVKIHDVTPPTFTAPSAISVNANNGSCTWVGTLTGPSDAADNCGGTVTVTNDITGPLTLGANTVTWTATDAVGNKTTHTQVVTVVNPVGISSVSASVTPAITNGTYGKNNEITGSSTSCGTSAGSYNPLYWGYQHIHFVANATNCTGCTGGTSDVYPSSAGCGITYSAGTLTVTDVNGCSASTSTGAATYNTYDHTCGTGGTKMQVCHYDNGSHTWQTICIDQTSVPDHMAHSHNGVYDHCGACGTTTDGYRGNSTIGETNTTFEMYPNPTDGTLNIVMPTSKNDVKVTITDITGRVVTTQTVAANTTTPVVFDLTTAPVGVYVVKANINGTVYTDKFVKH